ncbi:MAG: cytochrome c oxidase subunit 4 [Propionibacteriaceae bacterium]|nr:cytochrome c oxidase subunit 4 [Propionibacteriaceae bacterium]
MKAETLVFGFIAAFFALMTPIYWFMAGEIAGTFGLAFAGLLGLIITVYLAITGRSFDPRPEDRRDGEIFEGAGAVGFFPPQSLWPIVCAGVVTLIFLGPGVEQAWISIVGFGIGIWAASGWILEFYRGDYSH